MVSILKSSDVIRFCTLKSPFATLKSCPITTKKTSLLINMYYLRSVLRSNKHVFWKGLIFRPINGQLKISPWNAYNTCSLVIRSTGFELLLRPRADNTLAYEYGVRKMKKLSFVFWSRFGHRRRKTKAVSRFWCTKLILSWPAPRDIFDSALTHILISRFGTVVSR